MKYGQTDRQCDSYKNLCPKTLFAGSPTKLCLQGV